MVVSPEHRPPLPQGNILDNFCYGLIRPQGHSAAGRIKSTINPNDPHWESKPQPSGLYRSVHGFITGLFLLYSPQMKQRMSKTVTSN